MTSKKINVEKLAPQAKLVYEFLMAGRVLSSLIGIANLGVGDIRTRIAELRKKGVEISDKWAEDYAGKRFKQYFIKEALDAKLAEVNKKQAEQDELQTSKQTG